MHYAITNNSLEMLNVIISYKNSGMALKTKEGNSAVSLALQRNSTQIYEAIIKELSKREEIEKINLHENNNKLAMEGIIILNKGNMLEINFLKSSIGSHNKKKLVLQSNEDPVIIDLSTTQKNLKGKASIEIPFVFKKIPLNKSLKLNEIICN